MKNHYNLIFKSFTNFFLVLLFFSSCTDAKELEENSSVENIAAVNNEQFTSSVALAELYQEQFISDSLTAYLVISFFLVIIYFLIVRGLIINEKDKKQLFDSYSVEEAKLKAKKYILFGGSWPYLQNKQLAKIKATLVLLTLIILLKVLMTSGVHFSLYQYDLFFYLFLVLLITNGAFVYYEFAQIPTLVKELKISYRKSIDFESPKKASKRLTEASHVLESSKSQLDVLLKS
ncbi:hypothetical protein ACYSNM_08275 [Myroides sp. LJL116]